MDSRLVERLESTVSELVKTVAELKTGLTQRDGDRALSDSVPQAQREFLSVKDLARRIPYREQTIRNLMSAGEFKQGVHYYKRRRKVVFVWSAVLLWLDQSVSQEEGDAPFYPAHHARSRKTREALL